MRPRLPRSSRATTGMRRVSNSTRSKRPSSPRSISPAELEAWAAARTRESGAWEHAAELEAGAEALRAEVESARERVEAASALIDAGEAERAALPARQAELTAKRDVARRNADRVDDLTRALTAATSRRDAAVSVVEGR